VKINPKPLPRDPSRFFLLMLFTRYIFATTRYQNIEKPLQKTNCGPIWHGHPPESTRIPMNSFAFLSILVHLWEKTNQLTFQDRLLIFSIIEMFLFAKYFRKMLVRERGINNKGVPERPGTKRMVLNAISTTLKCQFTGKCWKIDFSMPCKPNRAKKCCAVFVRSVRSPWTPPDLPNFNLNYQTHELHKLIFQNSVDRL